MRLATALFLVPALAMPLVAAAAPSEAAPRKRTKVVVYGDYVDGSYGYAQIEANRRAYEAARAHSVDPAGDYRGYPNWARWALSPKGDNRR